MSANAFQLGAKPYNAISEIWAKTLLKNLSLVGIYRHIAVDHSSEFAANSDAVHLRIVDDTNLTVSEYYTPNEDSTKAGSSGTITYKDAEVKKHTLALTKSPYMAVRFELYALKQSDVAYQAQVINRAKYKVSAWIDSIVMNGIIAAVPAANTLTAFDATTAGEGDMLDVILQIAAKLKSVGAVPVSNASDLFGDKGMNEVGYVVVNPEVMRFILKEPAFVKVDFTKDNAMWKDGVIRGFIGGLVVLESSNLPTTTGTVNVFGGIKSAAHYAYKLIADRMIDDPNKFDVLWSTMYAAGVMVSHPEATVKVSVRVVPAATGN